MKSYIQPELKPKKTHPRPEPFGPELTAEGLESKDRGKSKPVPGLYKGKGGLGAWNLDIVCYLLFVAWNFLYLKTPLFLDIPFDFFNVFVGHDTIAVLS